MKIASHSISYSSTQAFPKLFTDYIEQKNEGVKKLYAYPPSLDSFSNAINDFSKQKYNRKLLIEVLKSQNPINHYPCLTGRQALSIKHIESLLSEKTFAVCTAHQPCLFTGPLYFIYKIVSAIKLARELKLKYPENEFIPVYWMGSEDHDLAEIGHAYLFGKRLEWKTDQAGAVGRMSTASLKPLMNEMEVLLGDTKEAKDILKLLSDCYLGQTTLSAATRAFVYSLFGEHGLVVIDGDDPRLKKEFAGIMEDDILSHTNKGIVERSIKELEKLGYEAQVQPREINLFLLGENARERILPDRSTIEDQRSQIRAHPERFSPNVVLRPLYQQMILPAIAYVGGPSEIAYWLQYKAMFDHHKVAFPVLVPRSSLLWIDNRQVEQMKKLDLEPELLFMDTETLISGFAAKKAGNNFLDAEKKRLKELFADVSSRAESADPTLKAAAEGELQRSLAALEKLESKMLRSEKQRQETSLNQVRKLKEKLFPEGKLQERHDNVIPYLLKYGPDFVKALLEQLPPFQQGFIILSEEG